MGGYVGGGGTTARGIGSLASTAARTGPGIATGGTSEIIAGVLNIIPSIFQGIMGGRQLKQARDIEAQNQRPEAVIAPSIDKLVNYARGRTFDQDIAGGTIARNEIKGATAAGLRAASELGEGSEAFGLMGELVGRGQNEFAGIARDTAQQVKEAGGDYMSALGTKAGEENRVWDWNKADKYLQAAQIAQQLRGSGLKNLSAGGKDFFGSIAESVSPDFNKNKDIGSDMDAETLKKILDSIYNKG